MATQTVVPVQAKDGNFGGAKLEENDTPVFLKLIPFFALIGGIVALVDGEWVGGLLAIAFAFAYWIIGGLLFYRDGVVGDRISNEIANPRLANVEADSMGFLDAWLIFCVNARGLKYPVRDPMAVTSMFPSLVIQGMALGSVAPDKLVNIFEDSGMVFEPSKPFPDEIAFSGEMGLQSWIDSWNLSGPIEDMCREGTMDFTAVFQSALIAFQRGIRLAVQRPEATGLVDTYLRHQWQSERSIADLMPADLAESIPPEPESFAEHREVMRELLSDYETEFGQF